MISLLWVLGGVGHCGSSFRNKVKYECIQLQRVLARSTCANILGPAMASLSLLEGSPGNLKVRFEPH